MRVVCAIRKIFTGTLKSWQPTVSNRTSNNGFIEAKSTRAS